MKCIPVTSVEQIEEIINKIKEFDVIAYDYETYEEKNIFPEEVKGLQKPVKLKYPINMYNSKIAGVGYGFGEIGYYVPVNHTDCKNFTYDDINRINSYLKDKVIVAHNLKFEYQISKINGIYFPMEKAEDTMLMAHEYNTEWRVSLKALAYSVFGIKYSDGDLAKKHRMNELSLAQVYEYGCYDVIITWQLYKYFLEVLEKESLDHYYDIELPTVLTSSELELNGVRVDVNTCIEEKKAVDKRLDDLLNEMCEVAGQKFNPRSTKQLRHILFDVRGVEPYKYSDKTMEPSCDAECLQVFAARGDGLSAMVLDYRKLATLNSNFFNKLPFFVNPITDRIHANFRQANTATGRFSSNSPNLQQLAKNEYEGLSVRRVFLPDSEDDLIVSLDLAGIELRICGFITRDPVMLDAFKTGKDLHTVTTQNVFGDDIVNHKDFKNYRKVGKQMNFLILYGGAAPTLEAKLGHQYSLDECEEFIRAWYEGFSGIPETQERIRKEIFLEKKVRTLYGRARTFETIDFNRSNDSSAAFRAGFNHLIQGTCGDMLKIIMLRIYYRYPELFKRMKLTIHDELVFSLNKSTLVSDVRKLHSCFVEWDEIDVPIYSSCSVGPNFGDLTDFETEAGDVDFAGLEKYMDERGWLK